MSETLQNIAEKIATEFQGWGGQSRSYRVSVSLLHELVEALRAAADGRDTPPPTEAPDEEMVPHEFEPRDDGGVPALIWCRHCEYHRDFEIHRAGGDTPQEPPRDFSKWSALKLVVRILKDQAVSMQDTEGKAALLPVIAQAQDALNELEARPVPPRAWHPIEQWNRRREDDAIFWIVPKTPEEAYLNTSSDPIVGTFTPRRHIGKFGTWSALSKAILFCELPADPALPQDQP